MLYCHTKSYGLPYVTPQKGQFEYRSSFRSLADTAPHSRGRYRKDEV